MFLTFVQSVEVYVLVNLFSLKAYSVTDSVKKGQTHDSV